MNCELWKLVGEKLFEKGFFSNPFSKTFGGCNKSFRGRVGETLFLGKGVPHILLLVLLFLLSTFFSSCGSGKSDEEKILDTVNGYLKEHALGNYEASYKYLAPQSKKLISKKEWVEKCSKTVNPVRLMKDIKVTDIKISGDKASAVLVYRGISREEMTQLGAKFYSMNFHLPMEEIQRGFEEFLIEHFEEFAQPQQMPMEFVRSYRSWKILWRE